MQAPEVALSMAGASTVGCLLPTAWKHRTTVLGEDLLAVGQTVRMRIWPSGRAWVIVL